MSIKWKIPILILLIYIVNIAIFVFFYRYYLSDQLNNRLLQGQKNIETITTEAKQQLDGKGLDDAKVYLENISQSKNVEITLNKIGDTQEYHFRIDDKIPVVFSYSQAIQLDNNYYLLTCQRARSFVNVQNVKIVNDILSFEMVFVFLMLLFITTLLYFNYAKPLVMLSKEMGRYKADFTDFLALRRSNNKIRKDEIGMLQKGFHELIRRLHEEKKVQDRMIASISHDLKTPLTSIMGYSENLLKKDLPPERQYKYINIIHNQSKDIEGIVEEFDDYIVNKMDGEWKIQTYSVEYLFHMLKDEYEQQLQERNVEFYIENLVPKQVEVAVDIGRLRRVFANIIGNAIRHANTSNLVVKVSAIQNEQQIWIKIRDNGVGIANNMLDKVFEPFYTSDQGRKLSGLGLAICKDIIQGHNGIIFANGDEGFSITFTLPIIK